jgi:hypothetical protein
MEKIFAALGGTAKVVDLLVKLIIAAIVIYLLYNLYNKWKRRNAGKQWVDTQKLDPAKNYDNLAKSVYDAFEKPWLADGDEMENAANGLLFLTDNELRHVNNRYLVLYGKNTQTIQDAITNRTCLFCESVSLLIDRMQKIGLN